MGRKGMILALLMLVFCISAVPAQGNAMTAGRTAERLLAAADDYNPGMTREQVLEAGGVEEGESVTREQALMMLGCAFGPLPELTGQNARGALPADFSDVEEDAPSALRTVLEAGIVQADEEGKLGLHAAAEEDELESWIRRVFALFGTNERDDFYAAVNRDALNELTIKPGRVMAGTLYDLNDLGTERMQAMIEEIITQEHEPGSDEQKIADFYQSIMDMDARNAAGIDPVAPVLAMIDAAQSVQELMEIQNMTAERWSVACLMSFGLMVDCKDSTRYMLALQTFGPMLPKAVYQMGDGAQKDAYIRLLTSLCRIAGETQEQAEEDAQLCYDLEKTLAEAELDPQDYADVDKIYNLYTMDELRGVFKNIDLDAVLEASGYAEEPVILVVDRGLAQAVADALTDEQLPALKAAARISILMSVGLALNQEFVEANDAFQEEFLGVSGSYTDEERAVMTIQGAFSEEIGRLYVQKYFSQEAKADVTRMVSDIMDVYRGRIAALDWMSEETKAMALRKLDTMGVKIGYPDEAKSVIDQVEIRSTVDGGSFFDNVVAVKLAEREREIARQGKPVDKDEWAMQAYTVNACYDPTNNDITFPAGILQSPMYDVNASYEKNLGGIGYVIAHEITHAFDNNGAKFDENGNAADWWTAEDYAAFEALCARMAAFYDGWEGVPGIPVDGWQTLSENVADQGAAACITQIVSELEEPDFETLYRSMAVTWASATTRENALALSQTDVHSSDKLRVNRVVVNCDPFYEAFGVEPGDGMYVAPEERVRIW